MEPKAKHSASLLWHLIALASSAYGFSSLRVLPDLLGVSMENEYGGESLERNAGDERAPSLTNRSFACYYEQVSSSF